MNDPLTTAEAARELGVTRCGVHYLIRRGLLPANLRGRDYWIRRADLVDFQSRRRGPGRPPKNPKKKT